MGKTLKDISEEAVKNGLVGKTFRDNDGKLYQIDYFEQKKSFTAKYEWGAEFNYNLAEHQNDEFVEDEQIIKDFLDKRKRYVS